MSHREVEKRSVLRDMTRQQLQTVGANRWLRRRLWLWAVLLVAWFAAFWLVARLVVNVPTKAYTEFGLFVLLVLGTLAVSLLSARAGCRFWDSLKDKPQPLIID